MHRLATSFVLGYHGCRPAIAEALLSGVPFQPSDNDYDWLGPGVYFWEANPERGMEFIREKAQRRRFDPAETSVVGAVVDLGLCLDFTTSAGIDVVKSAYRALVATTRVAGQPLPRNADEAMRRYLDCAVIRYLHSILHIAGVPRIQSVKGVFTEGDPIYPGAGFFEKAHIQIAVCDPACIKGVFRVPKLSLN
jgi:hypothetical protein